MAGKSFINGTRRLIYFGGSNEKAMSEADRTLGWNWTFWKRVLRPVIEEIGAKSVLYPALVAPDSPLPIRAGEAEGVEFFARQVGKQLFLLVCKREGKTVQVTFSGLPAPAKTGEVLFEAPRQMAASNGQFTDWFGPFEVHVYRFEL
ncbi:MAG TPA: hypothetical protein VNZ22_18085 [Bacillota bacterium]|nr:hypothetical protein [Bacillota bacterium]